MPKINQEEYEVLKGLDDKWEWIARTELDSLKTFETMPYKDFDGAWKTNDNKTFGIYSSFANRFQFIQWEDEEPHNIAELIREYEWAQLNKKYPPVRESEEKEVKKQKLIEKWESAIEAAEFYGKGKEDRLIEYMRNFVDDLNRLDEPEVLTQEFIDKYKVDYDNWMPAVPIVHLQNLLVPKQELPVIPNYVAKWISEHHERFDLYPALRRLEEGSTRDYDAYKWYRANTLKFVVAYLTGVYEVEEEQKYYAKIKGWELFVEFVGAQYWGEVSNYGRLGFVNIDGAKDRTKDEWEKLGINDTNADFVLAEELEE